MSIPIGGLTIEKNGVVLIHYQRDGGADFGAQFAMADPKEFDSRLVTDEQTKKLEIGGIVTYAAVVWNTGSKKTEYRLLVGGVR